MNPEATGRRQDQQDVLISELKRAGRAGTRKLLRTFENYSGCRPHTENYPGSVILTDRRYDRYLLPAQEVASGPHWPTNGRWTSPTEGATSVTYWSANSRR